MERINKNCELSDLEIPEYKKIVEEIKELENYLNSIDAKYVFMGEDNKYWEYAHVFNCAPIEPGMKVLDAGGGNSVVTPYLAKYKKATVCSIDVEQKFVRDAEILNCKMKLSANNCIINGDMRRASEYFDPESFDRIFSFSVIEHISNDGDICSIVELAKLLKPGGIMALTMDVYRDYVRGENVLDRTKPVMEQEYWWVQEQMYDTDHIITRIINPSKLSIYGNENLDYTTDFTPTIYGIYTVGALFLKKQGAK